MNGRIKELRKLLKLSQDEFGARLGITGSGVSNLENGRRGITEQMAKSICREFGVEYIWLKEGVGEMFTTRDDDILDLIDRILDGENETAKAVFKALAALDDSDWLVLQKIIESLQKK